MIAGSCEASSAQKKCLFSNKAGMGRRKVIAFVVRFSVQRFKVLSSLAFFFRLLKFSVFFYGMLISDFALLKLEAMLAI